MAFFDFSSKRRLSPPTRAVLKHQPSLLGLMVFCVSIALAGSVFAAELVMFDDPGCDWCRKWDKEIGAVYPKTAIGRAAPLRRVDIDGPRPADLKAIGNLHFTPTFILLHRGREVGRIVGYISEEFFWGYLEDMAASAGLGADGAGAGQPKTTN